MGTFFLESRIVVKRARNWVMTVAKTRCHVVRKMGKSAVAVSRCARTGDVYVRNFAVSRMYLLKTMVLELSVIHVLRNRQRLQCLVEWDLTYAMYTAG
jgi:membrane-associated PAP2 superfamily phosphatase